MSDARVIATGTAANAAGLVAGVVAAFAVQVLLARELPAGGLGLVTVAVQIAFVAAAGSRFGMDMAALRLTAIAAGAGGMQSVRALVDRCALVALAAGTAAGLAVAAASPLAGDHARTVAVGAASIPLAAAANTYLGATRGLKRMAPTVWVFWIGQPVAWLAVAAAALALGGSTAAAVAAYDASWLLGAVVAWALWRRASRGMGDRPASRAEVREALRYGAPRAPAALLAQLLFWADLFVLAAFASRADLDAYAAAGRVAQLVLLFLTSANLVFAPFVADLHARGRTAELDALFTRATRLALAATLPVTIVLGVAAAPALAAFGDGFRDAETALRILLLGQLVNVATGGVGYVLIMAGYTGVDLADSALAVALLAALAIPLASAYGMEGAAVAAASTIAAVNVLRLVQVRRLVGIAPWDAAFGRLAVPAGACLAAAAAAHALAGGGAWWLDVAATAIAGGAAYALVLPVGLSAADRSAAASLARRITNRPSARGADAGSR